DHYSHCREYSHCRWQSDYLADGLFLLAVTEASKVRHVEAQRRPESNHRRQRWNEDRPEFANRVELALLGQQITEAVGFPNGPSEQQRRHCEHKRRGPV